MLVLGAASSLFGCISPIALDRAVLEYDRTHTKIQEKLLLLNIARARNHNPIHFTAISNVAATFDFRMSASLARQPLRSGGSGMALALGGSMAENPTVNIVPVQGEAFTKRLLTPMDESKFEFLAHQSVDIGMVLRLMVRAMFVENNGVRSIFHNDARDPEQYRVVRRVILHLAALKYAGILDVGTINYEQQWGALDKSDASIETLIQTAERGYHWTTVKQKKTVSKTVRGRMLIANYDPSTLSNDERRQLDEKARRYPHNFILVDIRKDYPGGEFPIQAWMKLRSFNAVIEFIAGGMSEYPEFHVEKDPRSGTVLFNPVKTLEVLESPSQPKDVDLFVKYKSIYYWLPNGKDREAHHVHWNKESFKLLYHLYQMTVIDIAHAPVLPISIAK